MGVSGVHRGCLLQAALGVVVLLVGIKLRPADGASDFCYTAFRPGSGLKSGIIEKMFARRGVKGKDPLVKYERDLQSKGCSAWTKLAFDNPPKTEEGLVDLTPEWRERAESYLEGKRAPFNAGELAWLVSFWRRNSVKTVFVPNAAVAKVLAGFCEQFQLKISMTSSASAGADMVFLSTLDELKQHTPAGERYLALSCMSNDQCRMYWFSNVVTKFQTQAFHPEGVADGGGGLVVGYKPTLGGASDRPAASSQKLQKLSDLYKRVKKLPLGVIRTDWVRNCKACKYKTKVANILQQPYELAHLIAFIRDNNIRTMLEIGTFNGALISFLQSVFQFDKVAAVDFNKPEHLRGKSIDFFHGNTNTQKYRDWRKSKGHFDLVFIDAGHSFKEVETDVDRELNFPHTYMAFHDVECNSWPGAMEHFRHFEYKSGMKAQFVSTSFHDLPGWRSMKMTPNNGIGVYFNDKDA